MIKINLLDKKNLESVVTITQRVREIFNVPKNYSLLIGGGILGATLLGTTGYLLLKRKVPRSNYL